jgi:predicted ATPase
MMPIRSLSVEGYRSIRRARIALGQVNVIVGPNGCGKTNLYRSLYLLAKAADGLFARTLAAEGGMASALWAGIPDKLIAGNAAPAIGCRFTRGKEP